MSRTVHEQIQAGRSVQLGRPAAGLVCQSVEIWRESPVFGVGLRWWYSDRFDVHFQPPNAFLEMLTSAGVVGLMAFIVLCAGGLWVVFRLDPRYGNIALAVMIARFCQGQLDLYWVAGQLIDALAGGRTRVRLYARNRSECRSDGMRTWSRGSISSRGLSRFGRPATCLHRACTKRVNWPADSGYRSRVQHLDP